jgi:acylphosphatase
MPTVHLVIKGKVQGVFYRATARDVANKLGLTGWVKNREDGNVEIMATGGTEELREFHDWCRKGPSKSIVTEVEASSEKEQAFDSFRIVR